MDSHSSPKTLKIFDSWPSCNFATWCSSLRTWFFNTNVSEMILRFCGCWWFSAELKTLASFGLVNCLGCVSTCRPGKWGSLVIKKEFYLSLSGGSILHISLGNLSYSGKCKRFELGAHIWRLPIKRACWTCQHCSNSESPHSLTVKNEFIYTDHNSSF